jgi:hypothetical protein
MFSLAFSTWKQAFIVSSGTKRAAVASTSRLFSTAEPPTEQVVFPLAGKSVDDAPPRLRFAPSPTGRYLHQLTVEFMFVCLFVCRSWDAHVCYNL